MTWMDAGIETHPWSPDKVSNLACLAHTIIQQRIPSKSVDCEGKNIMLASAAFIMTTMLILVPHSQTRSWKDICRINNNDSMYRPGQDYLVFKERELLAQPSSRDYIPAIVEQPHTTNQPSPVLSFSPTEVPSTCSQPIVIHITQSGTQFNAIHISKRRSEV